MTAKDAQAQAPADPWAATIKGRPAPGSHAERARRTRMEDVRMFSEMTGDWNPLHYDEALAARTAFGGLIVQGGVTSGLLNALVAEEIPGPGSVFLGVEWRFIRGVRVGEEIIGRIEVETVRQGKPICTLRTTVRNAAGETCLAGTATTYTLPLRALRDGAG